MSASATHTGLASVADCVTLSWSNTEIWPFEIRVISAFRELNWSHVIAIWQGNSKIRLRRAAELVHTIVISHHFWASRPNGGGDRCRKLQFSEIQKPHDLDLDSGQGHINVHNTCSTTSTPSCLTLSSSNTEIWPFEVCVISTFREVWTHVIAFLEGNSKIGLGKAVDQVPHYHYQPSVLSSMQNWRRR